MSRWWEDGPVSPYQSVRNDREMLEFIDGLTEAVAERERRESAPTEEQP